MSLGTIAMISVTVKLLQAITTPFSRHLPKNSIFGHFSTIVPAHGRPIDPTSAILTKLGAVAMISAERKLFQAITTQFSHHLLENLIFSHFSPFVPAYGYPHDPISAFIDKKVITGCCCN